MLLSSIITLSWCDVAVFRTEQTDARSQSLDSNHMICSAEGLHGHDYIAMNCTL